MVSSHSTRKRLEKQNPGENNNSWGGFLNTNTIDLIDECFGVVCVAMTTAGDSTLSTANGTTDEGRRSQIILTGAPTSNVRLFVPAVQSFYLVRNKMTGSFRVRLTNTGGTNGVDFSGSGSGAEQGLVISDGTNVREVIRTVSIGSIYTPANTEVINQLVSIAGVSDVLTGTKTSAGVTPDALAAIWQQGPDTSVGTQFDLPAAGGHSFNISGTPALASISTATGGREIELRFTTSRQITNGAKVSCLGNANITTSVGDIAAFKNTAATDVTGDVWRMTKYQRINGSPLSINDHISSLVATSAQQQAQTGASVFVSPTTQRMNVLHPKAWGVLDGSGTVTLLSGVNVASISDAGTGAYTFTLTVAFTSANYAVGGLAGDTTSDANTLAGSDIPTTTVISLNTYSYNTGSLNDMDYVSFMAVGPHL